MFDIAWQEILVIGIVALIVVGPKELPTLLRTVGKYVGVIKRQAAEFRAQFDEAMRESEIEQLRKDVENIKSEAQNSFRDVERSVDSEIGSMKKELDDTVHGIGTSHADMHDANGLPMSSSDSQTPPSAPIQGAGAAAIAAAAAAAPPDASAPSAASESSKVSA